MPDTRIYDGHTSIFGNDSDTDPISLTPSRAAKSVNRIFRGGRNRPRPPFLHIDILRFEGEAVNYETVFRFGNFQGWFPYLKKKPNREDGIVVAIAGYIFFLTLVNEKIIVRLIFKGNDAKLLHTWFVQAEEWLYIQNGSQRPIFWDGQFAPDGTTTARRSDPALSEMPVGTIMVYAHGRVFLSNAFDQVAASDIIYGGGLTDSTGTQRFTENNYWAGGGYFGIPTELGSINGAAAIARQDDRLRTQGEVVFVGSNGAYAIEASVPRGQWQDAQVQTITLTGRGCESPYSVINVNNDLWMRSDDGIASYQTLRADQKRQLSFGKTSRHVNYWLDFDTPWLKQYCSMIYFDNRIISTVNPELGQPRDAGHGSLRWHKGMVALDLDQASDVQGDSSFNWDGLWTGVRPSALLVLRKRAYAFSVDVDGENRIYEITRSGLNDRIYTKGVQKKSFYITKRFTFEPTQKSNQFEVKRLIGGDISISEVRDVVSVKVEFRPDFYPSWSVAMGEKSFGSYLFDGFDFSLPRWTQLPFESPDDGCKKGHDGPINRGRMFQMLIRCVGDFRVDAMRLAMPADSEPKTYIPACLPNDTNISFDFILENDYEYNIVDYR